jgi:hypothetical protein
MQKIKRSITMSKREEKIALFTEANKKLGLGLDEAFLTKVTVGLGPSIYNKDSECVSCSAEAELATVRENYLKKKLGLTLGDDELNSAIKKVCEAMGSSNRTKYRALFYALLATNFKKESIYA